MDIQAPAAARSPSLKERQRAERAELILQAAEAVLAEKGYHNTSIDEIAARVGIAKGTVYLHYPSKDELVVALFDRELNAFRASVAQAAAEDAPARARLERILRQAYAGLAGQRRQLFLSLYASASVRAIFEKQQLLRDHMSQLAATIRSIFEAGQANGEFDRAIPPAVMLTTFLGLLSPRGYEHLLGEIQLSPQERAVYGGRIYFSGIMNRNAQ
jgi:AcrR family transcriptional regulator